MANLFELCGKIAIDCSGSDETVKDTKEKVLILKATIEQVGTTADDTEKHFKSGSKFHAASVWFGNVLTDMSRKVFDFSLDLFKMGLNFNSSIESYTAQFGTLLGLPTQEAEAYVERLRKFAEDTPYALEGTAINALRLLQAGIDSEEVFEVLEMLGDAALGNSDRFNRIAYAYSQIMSYGQLKAEEANQLIEAGFPIYREMEKVTGLTVEEMKKAQKQGGISSRDVTQAFKNATSESGQYHNAMDKAMETYAGQMEKTKDVAEQTVGKLTKPFFEQMKEAVLPGLSESLEALGTWVEDNIENIEAFAKTLGEIAVMAFDGLLDAFKWISEHGEAVTGILTGLSVALAVGAIAAHPYAAAIIAIVAGLLALIDSWGKFEEVSSDDFFGGYSQEEIDKLNEYIKLRNEAVNNAEKWGEVVNFKDQHLNNGILDAYEQWRNAVTGDYMWDREGIWQYVPSKESEAAIQSELQGMNLEAEVPLTAESNSENVIQAQLDRMGLTAGVSLYPEGTFEMLGDIAGGNYDGSNSHANGLDRVPFNNYRAVLHKNEAVLTSREADMWRNGGGTANTGRLEALMQQVLNGIQEIAGNTSTGPSIVLDSGVLVGRLTPGIDAKLGKTSKRKGRS